MKRRVGPACLLAVVLCAWVVGCDKSPESRSGTTTTAQATSSAEETTTTEVAEPLPEGQRPGYDDLDQDGSPDPICADGDYSAGLVLLIPCNATVYAPPPRPDTTPVPNSLYALPALVDTSLLEGATAEAIQARDPDGKLVVVFFIQSDVAFDVGASTLSVPAQGSLTALANSIQRTWPTAKIQVRGHTDATGGAAQNQTLSEQRATTVVDYLTTQGIDGSRLSSVGLGSTQPLMLETTTDGADNPAGRTENRRVEIVVHTP